jgi:hypothetical protein
MSHRRALLVPVLLLAVDACPSTPTSTPGQLGNGSFVYVCNDPADDVFCDGVAQSTSALPAAIAVGANFTVGYRPSAEAASLDPGSPVSATPSILADEGSGLRFLLPGDATIVVDGNGGIVDFAELIGVDIATFTIDLKDHSSFDCQGSGPVLPDAGTGSGGAGGAGTGGAGTGGEGAADAGDAGAADAGDAGAADAGDAGAADAGGGAGGGGTGGGATGGGATGGAGGSGSGVLTGSGGGAINGKVTLSPSGTADLTCDPVDSSGNLLAGAIAVTAESSDPTIVSIAPSTITAAHAIQLCGWTPGTVTITVKGGGKTATFHATVTSNP